MHDTDELPILNIGPSSFRRAAIRVASAAALFIIGMALFFWPRARSTTESGNAPVPINSVDFTLIADEPAADTEVPAGQVPVVKHVVLDSEAPSSWRVVGPDNLRVRTEPGTSGEVIGSFPPGDRNIEATGERVSIDGAEWKQIYFSDQTPLGWVSARYLGPDSATLHHQLEDKNLCFKSGGDERRIVLRFDRNGATQDWSGIMREDSGSNVSYDTVNGTGTGPSIEVVLTDTSDNSERTATWTIDGHAIVLMDATPVQILPCPEVDALLPNQ